MMRLARRIDRIAPSSTAQLLTLKTQKKAEGIDPLDFGAGEPDFVTPAPIREAGIAAIDSGVTRYTPVGGTPELKRAVAHVYRQDYGLTVSADEILITPGSKYGLFLLMQCLVEEGDEVILPRPYWVSYPEMIKFCGGKPVFADHLNQPRPLLLEARRYTEALSPRTRLVIVNSPANPSGQCMEDSDLGEVVEFFSSRGIPVVLDDCYRHIDFNDRPAASPYQLVPQARPWVAVVSSLSKSHAMTGWRIGYTVSAPELNRAMTKLAGHSTSNPCSISQYAAITALTGPRDDLSAMVEAFRRRCDLVCRSLEEIGDIAFTRPRGAFYILPDFSRIIQKLGYRSDEDFALALLEKENMIWAPGTAFGAPMHLRFSFAAPEADIVEGMRRLKTFCQRPTT
jgi:aspartate aminotransferase